MKQEVALRVLGQIMDWDEDRARQEFSWLKLMAKFKYDDYQDYMAGARFVECLADWLQQFDRAHRESAYMFVRSRLLYFSAPEIQHLVELVYPSLVERILTTAIAETCSVPRYLVWSTAVAADLYRVLLRKCLFLGLSDGARIDVFRRANVGIISNEQVVLATEINDSKWDGLLSDLRKSLNDPTAQFQFVFLLDDFVATGTTLIRKEGSEWKGRLPKFWRAVKENDKLGTHFDPAFRVIVHHYVATSKASAIIRKRAEEAQTELRSAGWFASVDFDFGIVLPDSLCISAESDPAFCEVVENYYDHSLYNDHFKLSGVPHAKFGFGGLGLPLVLEHNTPNNSVSLLWAESNGDQGHPMRALFRRRQRHS